MEAQAVQRDLEFILQTYGDAPAKPKTPEFTSMGQWKIESTCSACGIRIAAGQDRLVIAALELTHKDDKFTTEHREKGVLIEESRDEQVDVIGRREVKHYCQACSVKEQEFLISNPAFVEPEIASAPSKTRQEGSEVMETVKGDLAAGDDRSFNETFPERAHSKDAMARSTGMAVIGKRSGFGSDSLRVDAQSGEAVQRARVLEYMNDPRSKGKMLPDVRSAVRIWAGGASQSEVARKLGKDQSTVSRWIKTAQKMASAPR